MGLLFDQMGSIGIATVCIAGVSLGPGVSLILPLACTQLCVTQLQMWTLCTIDHNCIEVTLLNGTYRYTLFGAFSKHKVNTPSQLKWSTRVLNVPYIKNGSTSSTVQHIQEKERKKVRMSPDVSGISGIQVLPRLLALSSAPPISVVSHAWRPSAL